MRKLFFVIAISLLTSCDNRHDVGEYFYVGAYNLYHIDKACDNNAKVMANAHDTYKNTYKSGNQWMIKNGLSSMYVYFCSKCISDIQMNQIEDSIAKYQR